MSPLLLIAIIYSIATGSIDHDYILITWPQRTMNWQSAEQYCRDTYDSNLGTISTEHDYQLISNYSNSMAMIGLQYNEQNGIWSWINGPICDSICNQIFVPNTDQHQLYCSQIIANSQQNNINNYKIEPFDCNTPFNQFYCNKVKGYIYNEEPKTVVDAEKHCNTKYGAHLATISDIHDLQNAKQLITNNNAWIGLYRYNHNNIWLDGTDYVESNINNFIQFNSNTNCRSLQVHDGYIGNDNNCDELLPFLCNKRPKTREYILYKQTKTYIEAQQICFTNHGTDLATVITEEEFSDAMRLIPQSEGAWIGLRKQYDINNTQWVWIDGSQCIENDICVPYWMHNQVLIEPIYDCGWLWQHGRARTASCRNTMDYFLCNKPVIYHQIEMEQNGDIDKQKEEKEKHKNIISSSDIWHGKSIYYLHANQPYDATYRMPTDWIVIAGYIGFGIILICILIYFLTYILFLSHPSIPKRHEQRYYV